MVSSEAVFCQMLVHTEEEIVNENVKKTDDKHQRSVNKNTHVLQYDNVIKANFFF